MAMKKGYKDLLADAARRVQGITPAQALDWHGDPEVVFIDLRDPRELEREGMIPGAFHAPRGMLEFWVDPESPYHKTIFASGKRFLFYCAGGWRSALATDTVQSMGLNPVCHLEGGFKAWKEAGNPVAAVARRD